MIKVISFNLAVLLVTFTSNTFAIAAFNTKTRITIMVNNTHESE